MHVICSVRRAPFLTACIIASPALPFCSRRIFCFMLPFWGSCRQQCSASPLPLHTEGCLLFKHPHFGRSLGEIAFKSSQGSHLVEEDMEACSVLGPRWAPRATLSSPALSRSTVRSVCSPPPPCCPPQPDLTLEGPVFLLLGWGAGISY